MFWRYENILSIKFYVQTLRLSYAQIFGNVIGILIIVAVVNPILLLPSVMMVVMFYFLRRYYLKTARSVKRLEGVGKELVTRISLKMK